jgi:hypothetical protein
MVLDFSYSTYCVAAPQWMDGEISGSGSGFRLGVGGTGLVSSWGFCGFLSGGCDSFVLLVLLSVSQAYSGSPISVRGGGGYVSGVLCRSRFYSVDLDLVDFMLRSGVKFVGCR